VKKILTLMLLVFSINLIAQTEELVISVPEFEQLKETRLKRIKNRLIELKNKINNQKAKINQPDNGRLRLKYAEELAKLEAEYKLTELSFISQVSQVPVEETVKVEDPVKSSLMDEVRDVIKPFLDGIKRISKRPRMIEDLRSNISKLTDTVSNLEKAKKELELHLNEDKSAKFKQLTQEALKSISHMLEDAQLKLDSHKIKLHELMQNEKSLVEELKSLSINFLRTEGKNITIALLVFLLTLWPLTKWRSNILNLIRVIIVKFKQKSGVDPFGIDWLMKPISVMYNLAVVLLAFLFSILCLYLLNDWILVTFFILATSFALWGMKEKIPQFIDQFRLMLNFGPVREKERVIWNNIPWRVKKLGFYSILENPMLDGAIVRVHAKEMLKAHSRPIQKDEPWFPTQKGDWVDLSDGTHGMVKLQTPEYVMIQKIGGALQYYPTNSFIGLNPINLSSDSLIAIKFGLDYSHQNIITSEVLKVFETELKQAFEVELSADAPKFKSLQVDFDQAADSSLNLLIQIVLTGQFAAQKRSVTRQVNRCLVDISNKYGYVIPFNQLTLHMANSAKIN
jgi:hypothetical protein